MSRPQDIETAILYYRRSCIIGGDRYCIREELCDIKQMIKDEEVLLKNKYSKLCKYKSEIALLTKDYLIKLNTGE